MIFTSEAEFEEALIEVLRNKGWGGGSGRGDGWGDGWGSGGDIC